MGQKLTDGQHAYSYSGNSSGRPPSGRTETLTVSNGGNTLVDAYGSTWKWDEDSQRYTRLQRHGEDVQWDTWIFHEPPGLIFVQRFWTGSESWGTYT
jgi:hypothetical protein